MSKTIRIDNLPLDVQKKMLALRDKARAVQYRHQSEARVVREASEYRRSTITQEGKRLRYRARDDHRTRTELVLAIGVDSPPLRIRQDLRDCGFGADIEVDSQSLRKPVHPLGAPITRMPVVCKPRRHPGGSLPLLNRSPETRVANREELRTMVEPAASHTTCRHPPAQTATLVQQLNLPPHIA